MTQSNAATLPKTFWMIAILALLWYLMSALNFVFQLSPETIARMPESHQTIIASRPAWATVGFGLAVFAGVLGCVSLLLRRSAAIFFFALSAIGVVITQIPVIGQLGELSLGVGDFMAMIVMPLVGAILLVLYAKRAQTRGWIR